MVVYNETIGVINVTNKRHAAGFTEQDVHMLKAVADQAAVAVNKAQLWDMAVTDSLTGLYVRRYFMVKLQEEIHRAERYNKVLSVIMADLDHFKSVNDTYGHPAGDRVLEAIGRYLRKASGTWTSSPGTAGRSSFSCCRTRTRRRHSAWPSACGPAWSGCR